MVHVTIRFFSGQILTCEKPIVLPYKEAQLLFTIAAAEHTISVEKILDQLWPEADGDAAHNSFHVCLYRVRRHLNAGPLVWHKSQQYSLCQDVDVDLHALRAALAKPAPAGDEVEPFFRLILDGRTARNGLGDWFHPFEHLLIGYVQKCGHILCREALQANHFMRAAIYAREVIHNAPDDLESLETLARCNAAAASLTAKV